MNAFVTLIYNVILLGLLIIERNDLLFSPPASERMINHTAHTKETMMQAQPWNNIVVQPPSNNCDM